ncbi:MAG: serine protease [Nannocystaceae bacterium]|nr:trypsin-like peptidase domain-containing protein [Myxococcales bacterium]
MSELPVVRIYATTQRPDYDAPWQSCTPSSSTGSGVIIGHGKILTAAHVVANATFLQVQKLLDPEKWVARVAAVCHDCDLALLVVDAPAFMDDVTPAELGALPSLRDKVSVVGYPVGGEEVSITEGVVSRVEVQRYVHSGRHLLAVTVDAAINMGNSGGPVYLDGKVAGIAFQSHTEAENIGDVVPASVVRRFLEGVAAGRPLEIPGLGISVQNLENPELRAHIGMPAGRGGILVVGVGHGGSADGVLREGDAILEIDGAPVANNGTIHYLRRYRVRHDVEIGHRFLGDQLSLTILRDGAPRELVVELRPEPYLVARNQYDVAPTYFVFAGLVFQPLSRDFLATWDEWWYRAPSEFLVQYHTGLRSPERHEIVVLAQVLADEINVGYGSLYSEMIVAVNGHQPRDLADLVRRIEAATQAGGVIELRTSLRGRIVLDAARAQGATARILDRYNIPADRSPALQAATGSPRPATRSQS